MDQRASVPDRRGKECTDKRQEFILLSDTLGVSVLVISLNHPPEQGSPNPPCSARSTGKARRSCPLGGNLAEGVKGEPAFYSGRVLSADGKPIANALLDIWSGDGEGTYDMQMPGDVEHEGARQDSHGRRGALLVPLDQADVLSRADRRAGRRHAAQDGSPPESARATST